jgi:hypothetical protein
MFMFFGVVLITSKDQSDKQFLYTRLEEEEALLSSSNNGALWNENNEWTDEAAAQIPSTPISVKIDTPPNTPALSLPIRQGSHCITPRRRTSFDNGAVKRLSGSSVGTHTLRQMEFDLCSDIHAKSKSPKTPKTFAEM